MNERELQKIIAEKVGDFAGHKVFTKPLLCFEDEVLENWTTQYKIAPPKGWYRAGGDCVCKECNKKYYDHPHHFPFVILHVLCNGDCVKL